MLNEYISTHSKRPKLSPNEHENVKGNRDDIQNVEEWVNQLDEAHFSSLFSSPRRAKVDCNDSTMQSLAMATRRARTPAYNCNACNKTFRLVGTSAVRHSTQSDSSQVKRNKLQTKPRQSNVKLQRVTSHNCQLMRLSDFVLSACQWLLRRILVYQPI